MNFFSNIIDKLYLKQWSIGISTQGIESIIRNKKMVNNFDWFPLKNNYQFFADPFIFKTFKNQFCVLYEDYNYTELYGKISISLLDDQNKSMETRLALDTKSHLSYPNVFTENNKIYVFPEAGASGKLSCYCYDDNSKSLNFQSDVISKPLTDATFLKYNNKYWIFSTMRGAHANNQLFIFYSDSLLGTYTPHPKNPVKNQINGSRPAGNFIWVENKLYRPTQNSGKYYGSSITIYKISHLSEFDFAEDFYMNISPDNKSQFNFGVHTINYAGDLVVIDGLRRSFQPITQLKKYFRRK